LDKTSIETIYEDSARKREEEVETRETDLRRGYDGVIDEYVG